MTTSLGRSMQATALRLLKKYSSESSTGLVTTVTRTTPGAYNPTTSTNAAGSTATYTGYGNTQPYTLTELANSNIAQSDVKFIFSSSTRPKVDDLVPIDGVTYRVLDVSIQNVNGIDVVYTLQLRI